MEIVSYIRTWTIDGQYWNRDMLKINCLTEIDIAFALIKNGAEIYIPDEEKGFKIWDEVEKLKKDFPNLRIILSVGGWGADGFSDMAMNPVLRERFCKNVVDYIKKHNLDGVDIDWEYPAGENIPIKSRPEDRENYILLLKELRSYLDNLEKETGKKYYLSTAVPASLWFVERIDVLTASLIVDFLKVMCYDYYGSWSKTTGHHANLYENPKDPMKHSSSKAIEAYLNKGISAKKILFGIPFYGRGWKGVRNENNGLFQPYESTLEGLSFRKIKKLISEENLKRYWDDFAKAPYLYNGDIFISYIDEEALGYIVKYVKEKNLSGVMIWEYGEDPEGELLYCICRLYPQSSVCNYNGLKGNKEK